nr:PREDICTED: uncharacterized protein LOC105670517 [Linepithema humile]
MIEDVLKLEKAQLVLTCRFQDMANDINNRGLREKVYCKKSVVRNVLCNHFTKHIVLQLYKNVVTDLYNILDFKRSRIMKCLKIAKDGVCFSFSETDKITDEFVDKDILQMWLEKSTQ